MKQGTSQPNEASSTPPLVPPPATDAIDHATLQLLDDWRHQDATDNPDEIRAAELELGEFKQAMNENRIRAGEPPLYP